MDAALASVSSRANPELGREVGSRLAERVTSFYNVMDAAYCNTELRARSLELGHVPLIDHNPRGGEKIKFDPAERTSLVAEIPGSGATSKCRSWQPDRIARKLSKPVGQTQASFDLSSICSLVWATTER
jgi:hypothetical protein